MISGQRFASLQQTHELTSGPRGEQISPAIGRDRISYAGPAGEPTLRSASHRHADVHDRHAFQQGVHRCRCAALRVGRPGRRYRRREPAPSWPAALASVRIRSTQMALFAGSRVEGASFPNWVGSVRTTCELKLPRSTTRCRKSSRSPAATSSGRSPSGCAHPPRTLIVTRTQTSPMQRKVASHHLRRRASN